MTPRLQYIPYRIPYYENAEHLVAMFQKPSESAKTISSLEVKAKTTLVSCCKVEDFTIAYTVVNEVGDVDLMYLVSGPAGSDSIHPSTSCICLLYTFFVGYGMFILV